MTKLTDPEPTDPVSGKSESTNPEIEACLDELADLVCQTLTGESDELGERRDGLLRNLVMSGYQWKHREPLMVNIEYRVKAQCGEHAMHRGGALSSITIELGKRFESLARSESSVPSDESPAKAANISSATDA